MLSCKTLAGRTPSAHCPELLVAGLVFTRTLCLRSAFPSARRVKCDELRPKCKSCQKRNIKCHYELDPPGADASLDVTYEARIAAQSTPGASGWRDHNSVRPVKCGEQQPTCRRCVKPGYAYSGLLSPPPQPWGMPEHGQSPSDAASSSGSSPGDSQQFQATALLSPASRALPMRRRGRWPTRQSQDVTPPAEIRPPDWYYTEAVFYCKFCPIRFCFRYHKSTNANCVTS